jgi:hypothetical protein
LKYFGNICYSQRRGLQIIYFQGVEVSPTTKRKAVAARKPFRNTCYGTGLKWPVPLPKKILPPRRIRSQAWKIRPKLHPNRSLARESVVDQPALWPESAAIQPVLAADFAQNRDESADSGSARCKLPADTAAVAPFHG